MKRRSSTQGDAGTGRLTPPSHGASALPAPSAAGTTSAPGITNVVRGALVLLTACVFLTAPAVASATITLLGYPQELVSISDRVVVTWQENERCFIAYGPAPGFYPSRTVTEATSELTFVPSDEGMAPGIHFCVVRSVGTAGDSEEFQIVVESPVFPEPTSPPNGSSVDETTTLLCWDPVDRVPYYHVVVSDSEIEVSEEDGEIVITGARIIWQAITSATSIQYGSEDPSGHFTVLNGESPPLMQGFTYNWLVFNNYGNHPLLTSTAGAGLSEFTCDAFAAVDAPYPLSPEDGVAIAEDVVTFDWSDVPDAAGYHLYVHERRDWAGGEASYPVWNGATGLSEAEVPFGSFLPRGEYHWRVVALDGRGAGACSASRSLDYETQTGEARILTTDELGDPLPWVYVEIEFAQGGVEVLPAITNEDGVYEKQLIPGEYTFRATKTGHVDTLEQVTIREGYTTPVAMTLRRAPARIRGSVEDEFGSTVFDATVGASQGGSLVSTQSDADGNFLLTVTPGTWTLVASKQGYEPAAPSVVSVSAGDYHDMPAPLVVLGTPGTASGTVVNSSGNPLAAATVVAWNGTETELATTSGSGAFSLRLSPGRWLVHAEKSGFRDSDEREIEVPAGGAVALDPPIALSPIAASISGRVTNGENPVSGARVVAVPRSGPVVATTTNGYGEFVLLPARGSYVVRAFADGHAPSDGLQLSVVTDDAFAGLTLEVSPLDCLVTGRVTDGVDPVPSALVSSGPSAASTDAYGVYELGLRSGVHALTVSKPGYFPGPPVRVALAPGQTVAGLPLRIVEGACSISGSVECDGTPVAGAKVGAESGGSLVEIETEDDGAFVMAVEAGIWTVRASKDGFAPSPPRVVELAGGQDATGVHLTVDDESAAIVGTVSDGGAPVRRADVLVYVPGSEGPAYRTMTGSSGSYRVRVAPGESYVARAAAPGHGSTAVDVPALAPGAQSVVDIPLPHRDGSIEGIVMSAGEPVPGATVTAEWGLSVDVVTDRFGGFAIWVDEGLYDVRVEKAGYEPLLIGDVEVVAGVPTDLSPNLSQVFATLEGSVVDSLAGTPVEGALLTATWPRGGSSWVTGAGGDYSLASLVPGEVTLDVSAPGYRSEVRTLTLAESEAGALSLDLLELTGTIGGTVTSGTAGGLAGVSVRAKLGDAIVSTATTGPEGAYLLTGLDPNPTYSIHAGREGYYAASANPLDGVPTQTLDADFVLLASDGSIAGHVYDATSGEPLVGANVAADDGAGHFGEDQTLEDGSFSIDGLMPTGAYALTASHFGYHDSMADGVVPGDPDTEIHLPRNFARLLGTVHASTPDVALEEIEIVATSTSYGGESRVAVPEPSGHYEVTELRPGAYVASVTAPGCLSTPTQVTVAAGEGETIEGLDFTVERASVVRVEVDGPASIAAGASAVFTGDPIADGDRVVDLDLQWWISPDGAGVMDRASGTLTCRDDYIGDLTVAAREPESGLIGRRSVSVFAEINAETESVYSDSSGMTLAIAPGAVQAARSLYLTRTVVPDAKRYRKGYEVAPLSYDLKPSGLVFEGESLPSLSLPVRGGARLMLWSEEELLWTRIDASAAAGAIEAEIERLGEYATSRASAALGIGDVEAEPNPFSPHDGPTEVSYDLSSSAARMPFVTVRVFNMAAQLVRTLADSEPQGKGRASVEWDGLTDDGDMARNGRYVIEVRAEDATGTETALATVVLVK